MHLTFEQLTACHDFYMSDSSLRSTQRFGQYVWNKWGREPWPLLYYETDGGKAYDMLYKVCIK
jgi:hypothetical protein